MDNFTTMQTKNKKIFFDYNNNQISAPLWTNEDFIVNNQDIPIYSLMAYKFNGDLNNGTYIEIGTGHYKHKNNTYLLEKEYGWSGVSIDISEKLVEDFNLNRKNKCIYGDAIKFDWSKYLNDNKFPSVIDFLSIDIDRQSHESANLLALINLPLTQYKFKIIVIEHLSGIIYKLKKTRDMQREILTMLGYNLLIPGRLDDVWCLEEPNTENGLDQISLLFERKL